MQSRLAAMAKEQANMDSIRTEENKTYVTAEADRELGLSGVQKAWGVLRDYYGGASALIQDEQPAKHEAVKHHDLCESTPASIEKLVAACWQSAPRRASFVRKGKSITSAGLVSSPNTNWTRRLRPIVWASLRSHLLSTWIARKRSVSEV